MIEYVIEAMLDALLVIDVDGRVKLANTAASRITVRTLDELRGMPISALLVDDASGLRTVVRKRIEEGDVLRREDTWLVAKDGRRIPVSVTAAPVLDDHGEVQGIVLVARDSRELQQLLAEKESEILRRRRAEEELRAANESIEQQLEQTRQMLLLAERRATLGTLAGGVGHELRNIAQVQVAAVDELAAALETGDLAAARDMLPDLERVGEHITTHGNKLMQLARPGPDHVAPIDLNDVVRDVASMLVMAGKLRQVHLALSLSSEALTVTVNRTRIEQILVNLVTNAVDATPSEGKVTVHVEASADGKRAICQVRDTGSGISPERQKQIFEPFYTTKGEQGTGLGLPVVRDIVESYGGTITCDSEVGNGTTFTFDLPR